MKQDQIARRLILVAGVPRSGSTWLFNAARQLLESTPHKLYSAWVEDYRTDDPAPVHLVKIHQPEQMPFDPDLILTTRRQPEACLASLIRMGWLANAPDKIRASWTYHRQLYDHWADKSDLEIRYEQIINDPQTALDDLTGVLGLTLPPATLSGIATDLAALKAPEAGKYDPKTLLHPSHRKSAGDNAPAPADILRIVGQ